MSQNSPPEVNEFLTRQAQDWHGDAKTPPHITEAVRSAVFGEKKNGWLHRVSRRQMAAACVFLIPISFVATRYIAGQLLPNPTLAAIARAMSEVRTAQWQNETEVRDPKAGTVVRILRQRYMVDLDLPAARSELEPDQIHIHNAEGYFMLQGKHVIPMQTTNKNETAAALRERLQRLLFNGNAVFKNKEEWEIGETVVDGRRLLDLRRTVNETVPAGTNVSGSATIPGGTIWGGRQEIWADPETFRIVQIRIWFKTTEREAPYAVRDVTNTAHSYEYNKVIPTTAFQVTVPER